MQFNCINETRVLNPEIFKSEIFLFGNATSNMKNIWNMVRDRLRLWLNKSSFYLLLQV